MRGTRGFTIIELMIVVTIIGILAAIAIPVFQGYSTRAKISEGPMLAQPVKVAIADFFTIKGDFPADNADLGLDAPATLRGKYVASVEVVANGVIIVTYGDPSISGRTLTFTPTALDRAVQWNCVTTLPPQLTPKGC